MHVEIPNTTKRKLIDAIHAHLKSNYPQIRMDKSIYKKWAVGVTNKPSQKHTENLSSDKATLNYWACWNAKTNKRAIDVENFFCNKGFSTCQNARSERGDALYVDVFKEVDEGLM